MYRETGLTTHELINKRRQETNPPSERRDGGRKIFSMPRKREAENIQIAEFKMEDQERIMRTRLY